MENKEIQLKNALKETEALTKAIHDTKKKTNPTNLKKGMKQKSIIGAILLLILVLTGTFAWQSYQQRAINPFYDPSGNHGVRFHDRLELEDPTRLPGEDRFGYANMVDPNLNIFAENFGDMDVFVRIQLREFFAIDNDDYGFYDTTAATPVPAVRNNPNTWPVFRTSDTNINQRRYSTPAYRMGHEDIIIQLGQPEGDAGRIDFIPTFNHAVLPIDEIPAAITAIPSPFNHYNAYRMSEATGAAVDWFTNHNGPDGQTLLYEGTGNPGLITDHIRDYILFGIPTGPGITDPTTGAALTTVQRRTFDTGTRALATPSVESHRIYTYLNAANEAELRLSTATTPGASADGTFTHDAQPNQAWYIDWSTSTNGSTAADLPANPLYQNGAPQPFRGVMTIGQWEQLGRPQGNFWIHDSQDEDGFFYWMGYLEGLENPDESTQLSNATSLLVESLDLTNNPLEWEYALYMNGEAFTRQSIEAMNVSTAAMQIFNVIVPEVYRPVGGTITVAANGEISISDSLTNANMQAFTRLTNSLGSYQSNLPSEATDLNLINIEGPGITSGDFIGVFIPIAGGYAVRVTENLPVAVGCPATGTPANLWTDDTGIEWCVIATSGHYSMLLTREVHNLGQAHDDGPTIQNPPVLWPDNTEITGGPTVRTRPGTGVNAWWAGSLVSNELRQATVHANLPVQRTTAGAPPDNQTIAQNTANLSTPRAGTQNGLPFFLSYADVLHRVDGTVNAGTATVPGTSANRVANRMNPDGTIGERAQWWLREASFNPANPVTFIGTDGNWGGGGAGGPAQRGFRLGIWVRR